MSGLIPCPSCRHVVSPEATSCPSCGYPVAAKLIAVAAASRTKSEARKIFIFFAIAIPLCIWFAMHYVFVNNPQSNATSDPAPTATPAAPRGTRLSRKTLMAAMSKGTNGFVFEKGKPEPLGENFVGTSGKCLIQLVGPEDDLRHLLFVVDVASTRENFPSFVELIGFAHAIDPESDAWLRQSLAAISKSPSVGYDDSTILKGRNFRISYSPDVSPSPQVLFVVKRQESQ